MAIIRITESFENYKEFQTDLVYPASATGEKLYAVLYKREVNAGGMIKTIKKKPLVTFMLPNNKEVPKRKWTPKMKAKALEYAEKYPILDYGKTFTTFGKVFYTLFGLMVLGICGVIAYLALFSGPRINKGRADFSSLPEAGDKYYGSFTILQTQTTNYTSTNTWIKITAINPTDSICTYQLSSQPSDEHTFDTLNEEHNSFAQEVLQGKFSFNERAQKLKLKAADNTMLFEATVMNNEFGKYKISGE